MASIAECSTTSRSLKVKVGEQRRHATFVNPDRQKFTIVRADGCLYEGILSADFVVCSAPGDLIIELKGTNVEHAVKQVIATLGAWKDEQRKAKIAALIVCSRYPRVDTSIQRAKRTMSRDHKCKLSICSRNTEHDFASLFSA